MISYWLFKTEPTTYSVEDLQRQGRTAGEGVRNYQARNFMKQCKAGDVVFVYHSNTKLPGIYGIGKIITEAYPDVTQFDPQSKYYDAKATNEKPRWVVVDVEFVEKFKTPITLQELKNNPALQEMNVVQKGNRLSVMPVTNGEFEMMMVSRKEDR